MVKRKAQPPTTKLSSSDSSNTRTQRSASPRRASSPSSASSLLYKRVLSKDSNNRQEIEEEEIFDVLSIASDTLSAISISSSTGSGDQKLTVEKGREVANFDTMSSSKRKRNGGTTKSLTPSSASSKTPSKSKTKANAKAKVPTEYIQMVNEVIKDEFSGSESENTPHRRSRKRDASRSPHSHRITKKVEATPSWSGIGKGKEKVIDLDPDAEMSDSASNQATRMAPISSESAAYLASYFAGMSSDSDNGGITKSSTAETVNKSEFDGTADEDRMESEDSNDDDDMEWENVDIGAANADAKSGQSITGPTQEPKAVEFTIGESLPPKNKRKKPPITREEREQRIVVHLIHLICLVCHGSIRSRWCNDASTKENLSKFVPSNIEDELKPDPTLPVVQRTRKFLDGLRHLMEFWNKRYHIIYKGMRRRAWEEIETMKKEKDTEPAMDLPDFRRSLGRLEGSRDLGAQGFCALLRSLRVRTRLVFSLQPLPFTFASRGTTPKSSRASRAITTSGDKSSDADESSSTSQRKRPPVRLRKPRMSTPTMAYITADYESATLDETPYPVFWVEAWDEAGLQWVSVDPMVLKLVEIPRSKSKFEPPQSETRNVLSYVIAFDQAGNAKDVTRRYAQYYNAKTRKLRITNEPIWQIWYDQMLRDFQSGYITVSSNNALSSLTWV